ncbi:transglutaminase-like superfamily protein [Clostridium sporogenes]|uniref:transglutaminase domain-containing protein n=1 Tax=Clostridium TaxID=1485 RepID=UPI00090ADDB9|nr:MULTISPECIES: transglutaminase domain-containing protein [Clostridium]APF27362.1 transglutaminase-like superfamily protein [Clostridium sporogenes]MDI6918170.1 transglutaminase domain-containing protein [Clostridium botulinum]WMU98430.1 transglutaminase domain-containing protein [Clostridium botulinum]
MQSKKIFKIIFKVFLVVFILLIAGVVFINYRLSSYAKLPEGVVRVTNKEEYYKAIEKAMCNYDEKLTVAITDMEDDSYYNIDTVEKVLRNNPQLNDICIDAEGNEKVLTIPIEMNIDFKYSEDVKVLKNREKAVQAKVKEIIGKVIKPGMKDYEKELALHDYLVNNAKYDVRIDKGSMPKESNTAYGVLINKLGACVGYSDAMKRLLDAVNIESKIIVGSVITEEIWSGHAWNLVKIGGQYHHLDVTWDDPINEDGSNTPRHTYFNISDAQIKKTHQWDEKSYPKCNSTKFNFKNLGLSEKDGNGNTILTIHNYDEFYSAIQQAVVKGKKEVSINILNFNKDVYDLEKVVNKVYRSIGKEGPYSWVEEEDDINNSKIITLTFE